MSEWEGGFCPDFEREKLNDNDFKNYIENRKKHYKKKMLEFAKNKKMSENNYIGTESPDWECFVKNNFDEIQCKCTITWGFGMITALTLSKKTEYLERLEKFRKDGIFMDIFGSNYPETVEEYDGELRLQFVWGTPEVKQYWKYWNASEEEKKVIRRLTLKENVWAILKPDFIQKKIEAARPRYYSNCEDKMKGKSYLDLMDCQSLFGKQVQKQESELSQ